MKYTVSSMSRKFFNITISIFLIAVAIGIFVLYENVLKQKTVSTKTNQNSTQEIKTLEMSNQTKEYVGSDFKFSYPSILTMYDDGMKVVLTHAIDNRHEDVCDMKGGAPMLQKLTDFNVTIKYETTDLKSSVYNHEGADFVKNNFDKSDLKMSKDFIDEISFGELKGFQITQGIEGCGRYTYYFPIKLNRTLFVERAFVPEFNQINESANTFLALPGIVTPKNEKEYFQSIISSIILTGGK